MTTVPVSTEDTRAPINRLWLGLGALGAGLTVFAYGPVYMPLVWALALVLSRSSETARHSALAITTVAATFGALPIYLEGDVFAAAAQFLLLAAAGMALHFALDLTGDRNPRGLLLAAAAWLVLPSAPGVVGLVLLALYLGHERQVTPYRLGHSALPLMCGAALLAGLLALTLPSASTPRLTLSSSPATEDSTAGLRPDGRSNLEYALNPLQGGWVPEVFQGSAPESATNRQIRESVLRWVTWGMALALPLLAIFLVRLFLLDRVRRRRLRLHWSDPLVIAALVLVMVTAFLMAIAVGADTGSPALSSPAEAGVEEVEGGGGAAEPLADGRFGRLAALAALWLQPFLWATVLFLLARLAFARFGAGGWNGNDEATPLSETPPPAPPAERVRRAYLAVMQGASGLGLGRAGNETPQEWAARLSEEHPELSADLAPLTEAYEGVRYGQLPDEAAAADAEARAGRLAERLGELIPTPPEEGTERA